MPVIFGKSNDIYTLFSLIFYLYSSLFYWERERKREEHNGNCSSFIYFFPADTRHCLFHAVIRSHMALVREDSFASCLYPHTGFLWRLFMTFSWRFLWHNCVHVQSAAGTACMVAQGRWHVAVPTAQVFSAAFILLPFSILLYLCFEIFFLVPLQY